MRKIILEEKRKSFLNQNLKSSSLKMRYIVAGLTVFLIVLFIEIWVVNRNSTYGNKIYQLKQARQSLELENQILSNAIASASSMVLLEKKANLLGFNTINQIDYIKVSDKLASAQ